MNMKTKKEKKGKKEKNILFENIWGKKAVKDSWKLPKGILDSLGGHKCYNRIVFLIFYW